MKVDLKKNFPIILFLSAIGLNWLVDHIDSKPRVATYKIDEDTRTYLDKKLDQWYGVKEDNRFSPIIHIRHTKKNGGACTAFVINNTTALTAGHCFNGTKEQEDNKQEELKHLYGEVKKVQKDLADVISVCKIRKAAYCDGEIIVMKSVIQSLYEQIRKVKAIKADTFLVYNTKGKKVDVHADPKKEYAIAWSKYGTRDFGYLWGDFRAFKKLPVTNTWTARPKDVMKACGYHGSKFPPTCTNFIFKDNYSFKIHGDGIFMRGVSGGPIIDHRGVAVGIAVSVGKDGVYIEPLLGLISTIETELYDGKKEDNK